MGEYVSLKTALLLTSRKALLDLSWIVAANYSLLPMQASQLLVTIEKAGKPGGMRLVANRTWWAHTKGNQINLQ